MAKQTLAVVLARSGSKRIPQKNIRLFAGKPMLAWPVGTSVGSKIFDDVVISTDDENYARIAVEARASFYGLRPSELSSDHATSTDVMKHEILQYEKRHGRLPLFFCCLYGTSVFVSRKQLVCAFEQLNESDFELVMGVSEYPHPIERALRFDASGALSHLRPEFMLTRTQDIQPSYYDIGLLYFFKVKPFLANGGRDFSGLLKTGLVLPHSAAVDIDTEADWKHAEKMFAENL